jgi:hypothetical protein
VASGLGSNVGGIVTTGATSEMRCGTGVPWGVNLASSGRRGELRATCGRAARGGLGRRSSGTATALTVAGAGLGRVARCGWGVAAAGRARETICAVCAATTASRLTLIASSGDDGADPAIGEKERRMKNTPATVWMKSDRL